jgi:hypothetical protein
MAYKSIRVWDGSAWQEVGSQVPSVLAASGFGTVTLAAGAGTYTVAFGAGVQFATAPLGFAQLTGSNHATAVVITDTVGITINFLGTGTSTITFNWFVVQGDIV